MLLYFIVYYAMGLIIACGLGLITMLIVYKKGYDLEDFNNFMHKYLEKEYTSVCEDCGEVYYNKCRRNIEIILGYLIWPIRIFENRHLIRELINMYEKHLEESE